MGRGSVLGDDVAHGLTQLADGGAHQLARPYLANAEVIADCLQRPLLHAPQANHELIPLREPCERLAHALQRPAVIQLVLDVRRRVGDAGRGGEVHQPGRGQRALGNGALADLPAPIARHDVEAPQLVEHGAVDAVLGVGAEVRPPRDVEATRRFDQGAEPRGIEVVVPDDGRQPPHQAGGGVPDDLRGRVGSNRARVHCRSGPQHGPLQTVTAGEQQIS